MKPISTTKAILPDEALLDSEARYRWLFESTAIDGIMILDGKTGQIVDVNPFLTKLLGFSREQVIKKKIWELGDFKDIIASKKNFEDLLQKGFVRYDGLPLKTADGLQIDVEFVGHVYEAGTQKMIQCSLRDITARKRAEEELRENNEFLEKLITFANTPTVVWDSQFRITHFNYAFESLLGRTADEVLRQTLDSLFPPARRQVALDKIQATLAGEQLQPVEVEVQSVDGDIRTLLWSAAPIFDKEGKVATAAIGQGIDITERKRAEREIASLAKFPSENPGPVLRISRDGVVLYANAASAGLLDLWGCAVGDPAPQFWRDLAAQTIANGENKTADIECAGKVYSIFVTPVAETGYVNLYARDITERMRAGEEAHRQKEITQRALDNIPVMITYFDETGTIKMVNREIVKILGWSVEEWQTEDVLAKSYPDPEALKEVLDFMKNKPIGWKDFKTTTKNGAVIDTTFTNIILSDGVSMGIGRDITERKRAEATILASEARYRMLVENAGEAIIVAQDGLLKFVNQTTLNMTGYSEKELISRPFPEFIHPDDRERVVASYWKRFAGKAAQSRYAIRLLTRAGSFKWVEIGAVLIDWEGRPATLNFLTDISDRHKAEEVIQESLREKEVMLREIHHRVKNNMQVIYSLFNLQAGKTANPEFREIMKEGQTRIRAMSLVHEKLYQSRDLSKIDLAAYIQSLADHLFNVYLADSHRIRLETDLEEVPLDINSAVPCGLILNELISNSLKHAFPEGRKGLIRIGLKRGPDGKIILRVADDGVSFPKHIDFLQSESLGLQIANLLVGQIDGTIELDRTNGTTFTVTFREIKEALRI